MSWWQALRDEVKVDGRSFFDTDYYLLLHKKNSSSALIKIGRSF